MIAKINYAEKMAVVIIIMKRISLSAILMNPAEIQVNEHCGPQERGAVAALEIRIMQSRMR